MGSTFFIPFCSFDVGIFNLADLSEFQDSAGI